MNTGRVNAPELHTKFGWLNTDKEYSLKDFRGKFVLLDFWTYGCINCQHILPDLKKLETEYADKLVVIGIHSAKFDAEKSSEAILKAVQKFGISHPVINDADFNLWRHYAINAWPTVVLIDPNGKVIGQRSGEDVYDVIKPYIDQLLPDYEDNLNLEPFQFKAPDNSGSLLRFPSKMLPDGSGNVYVSDSGHNRILKLDSTGKILEIIGSGEQGFGDGTFTTATFYEPHGLALHGNLLYVADSKNNAIRRIDLNTKNVFTAAGSGALGRYYAGDMLGVPVNPNSPWDLAIKDTVMYIACAGNHQILQMDLKIEVVTRFAGTGSEALVNGNLHEAAFNQPSGLVIAGSTLFVADAEASAIRAVSLNDGSVSTLIGKGLFDFGDMDGNPDIALLQHAVGITERDNCLFIADTYNGKIRKFDLNTRQLKTVASGLDEPNDVKFINSRLWVSSTNAHRLFEVDPETGNMEEVRVRL